MKKTLPAAGDGGSLAVPDRYEGVTICGRGLTLGALYASPWAPGPDDPGWFAHPYVSDCWRHERHPGLIVARHTAGTLLVAHLAKRTPKLHRVEELAKLALGPTATPFSASIYPLAFRLPMTGAGLLALPTEPMRCRRLWPAPAHPAHVEDVAGVSVEFRISASTTSAGTRLYAEAFIGGPHERAPRADEEPNTPLARALLFDGDARHVLTQHHAPWVERFTAQLLDRLLMFAYARRDVGLEVSLERLRARRLAVVRLMAGGGDVEFAIWLPQTTGESVHLIGNYFFP